MTKLAITHGEPFINNDPRLDLSIPFYLSSGVERIKQGRFLNLEMNESDAIIRTYLELWSQACRILTGFKKSGVVPRNQPVIVILDGCNDFIPVLWSCLIGGIVPIPVRFSINYSKITDIKIKLKTILDIISAPIIITNLKIAEVLEKNDVINTSCRILEISSLETSIEDKEFYLGEPDELGALFFSSGTTGKPKLVSFTRGTILNRLLELQPDKTDDVYSLYWLPPDHASACLRMLNPDAMQKIFLPTEKFLVNPLRWLDAIEKYSISKTSITNFGMTLINRSLELNPGRKWDLSSLLSLGIGAEIISPQTYKTFLKNLTSFGLDPKFIFTGYGLTECGTVVGGKAKLIALPHSDKQYMGLGKPCRGYSIRIVDEQGSLLDENVIGNIQVKGVATTKAYYNQEEESQKLFTQDNWLNTGDLGFLQDGNLVITGRDKDIIIINAKNYCCGEIEEVANFLRGIDPSGTVALGVPNLKTGTEDLIIFFVPLSSTETNAATQDKIYLRIIKNIKVMLLSRLNINPVEIIPITQSDIPRTSFGKIQRDKLAQKFQNGEFNELIRLLKQIESEQLETKYIAPKTETEKVLAQIWSRVLGRDDIGCENNFFDLGGQSILAAQVIASIEERLGIKIPLYIFFNHTTIAELAFYLDFQSVKDMTETSVIPVKPDGTRIPLYFINDIDFARKIAALVDVEQPVYCLNIFGLTTRMPIPFDELEIKDFAKLIIQDLQKVHPKAPYQFIGFCQNGALTLEVAQQLTLAGEQVNLVCLIDVTFQIQKLNWQQRLSILLKFNWLYVKTKLDDYKKLKYTEQKKQKLIDEHKNQKPNIESISKKIELDTKLYQVYLKAQSKYIPKPYLGNMLSLKSIEWSFKDQSKLLKVAQGNTHFYELKTFHYYLFEKPFINYFAEILQKHLKN